MLLSDKYCTFSVRIVCSSRSVITSLRATCNTARHFSHAPICPRLGHPPPSCSATPGIGSYCIPSCITHRPLPTCQISLKLKKLFVDRRTFETGFIKSTLSSSRVMAFIRCRHITDKATTLTTAEYYNHMAAYLNFHKDGAPLCSKTQTSYFHIHFSTKPNFCMGIYLFIIRDGRILIFSRIPDSDTRHLISGRSRIRIFDVTTVSLYLQQNTGNRIQLLFSVIHNVTHVT